MNKEAAQEAIENLAGAGLYAHNLMSRLRDYKGWRDADRAAALLEGVRANLESTKGYVRELRELAL